MEMIMAIEEAQRAKEAFVDAYGEDGYKRL